MAVGAQDATSFDALQLGGGSKGKGQAQRGKQADAKQLSAERVDRQEQPAQQKKPFKKTARHMLAGALAGATAKTIEAPLDRVKIIFQVNKEKFTLRAALTRMGQIARTEGVQGLWKGNGAMLVRVMPYAAINYATHETLSRLLTPEGSDKRSPVRKFIAGALTGMTSTICTYPIDVARARMAVAPMGVANSLLSVFREMYHDPRKVGAFYAGLTPTLMGIIPYSGTTWSTYETLKERTLQKRGMPSTGELPLHLNALCGGLAGIMGQTVSYPLDVVRRRMQTAQLAPGLTRAPTMVAVFRELVRTEGAQGLFKGLSVNYFKAPIALGISFSMYHKVKEVLDARDWP